MTSVTGVRVVSLAVPIVISEGGENKAIACSVFRVDQPNYL